MAKKYTLEEFTKLQEFGVDLEKLPELESIITGHGVDEGDGDNSNTVITTGNNFSDMLNSIKTEMMNSFKKLTETIQESNRNSDNQPETKTDNLENIADFIINGGNNNGNE